MKKSEIKQIIKAHGYTMISASWFDGDKDGKNSVIFNAFDGYGDCYSFYVNFDGNYATRQALSIVVIHKAHDVTQWFF